MVILRRKINSATGNSKTLSNKKYLTLTQFVNNPTGAYSAQMGRRDVIKENLMVRYSKLLNNNKGTFKHTIYKDKDNYIFYFNIPSETLPNYTFDVIIKFIPIEDSNKNDPTISNYTIELFSNSPNFTFTYTYVLNKSGLLFNELKKCNSRALNDSPKVRNPVESLGYEKSIYFAGMFIRQNKMMYKSVIDKVAVKWDPRKVSKGIMNDLDKYKNYTTKVKAQKAKEKEAKRKSKAASDKKRITAQNTRLQNKRNNSKK